MSKGWLLRRPIPVFLMPQRLQKLIPVCILGCSKNIHSKYLSFGFFPGTKQELLNLLICVWAVSRHFVQSIVDKKWLIFLVILRQLLVQVEGYVQCVKTLDITSLAGNGLRLRPLFLVMAHLILFISNLKIFSFMLILNISPCRIFFIETFVQTFLLCQQLKHNLLEACLDRPHPRVGFQK